MPLTARLRWIENESCLVIVAINYPKGRIAVPLWPKGTTPLHAPDGRRGVTVPTGEQVLDGDTFSGGGSWIFANYPGYPQVVLPAGCGKHDAFFTVDSTELRRTH